MIELYDHQLKAVAKLRNGSILCGGVGSGKSRTAIAYYYILCKGNLGEGPEDKFSYKNLYIITTARKRDTKEWEKELEAFSRIPAEKVTIDSWNNIKKYVKTENAFFIFDEQRVVGYGAWTRAFLKICKSNRWILLSATPGDTFMDYIPVFIANGFYKNKRDFVDQHVIYSRYSQWPKVDRFIGERKLESLRDKLLVDMDFLKPTERHNIDISCTYDRTLYRMVMKYRTNPYTNEPIENYSELAHVLRKIVNSDPSRAVQVKSLFLDKGRVIIFYNFNYELEILKNIDYGKNVKIAEWNGQKHELIPKSKRWVYLVQYTAGAEGWNCVETDTVIFYSQNYSYRAMEQASGRIDRLNTPFKDLYYYHLKSKAPLDLAIARALKRKRKFNARSFFK